MTEVAAAIIKNNFGEILICKRGPGGSTAYLWEFPGGKKEPGETLPECLLRECQEELCAQIKVGEIYTTATYDYPEGIIDFTFFVAYLQSYEIKITVHEEAIWVKPENLKQYDFCPADIRIIEMLSDINQ